MLPIEIKTNTNSKKNAIFISKKLISNNIVASINIIKIKSFYIWNDKLKHKKEYCIIIKSLSDKYNDIERIIIKHHNYKIPGIYSIIISNTSSDYLEWIKKQIK